MTRLITSAFTISLDGFGAGPDQSRENPLGVGGEELHDWLVSTRTFKRTHGGEGIEGDTGIDEDFAARSMAGMGARPPLEMEGGTVFHFVTDGIQSALERARDAAGGLDIRLGGGVATIRQYLQARLIDEMHLAVSPILLGSGEQLFAGLDLLSLGYRCTECVPGAKAVHYIIART